MTKERRSFSAVFKCEADDLVLKQNYSYQWRASARSGREKLNAVSGLIDHYTCHLLVVHIS